MGTTNTKSGEDYIDILEMDYSGNQLKKVSVSAENAFAPRYSGGKLDINMIINVNGGLPCAILENQGGGGVTTPTSEGTYTVIFNNPSLHPNGRNVTTGHELFGHGRSTAVGKTEDEQHESAIQVENLILRVMNIPYINDGHDHGPQKVLPNATALPNFR
ncbi:MAG: hypothetical protein K6E54_01875 [Bacteroidaceae bacterium]|nr:hypothetical protein [Bacteroidaceae bacterium]